mmetsp:Transcript_37106/g.80793  ORF Transcript_37106/g.80793 Transcript_37106/m.80793 type:complete len:220 (-) Transcript_37106:77-736(-)
MEAAREGHELVRRLRALLRHRQRVLPRELDRALIRLSARVAEESAVGEGDLAEAARELRARHGVEEVANMGQLGGLVGNRLCPHRVAVAEDVHRNARREIEKLLAFGGIQLAPLAVCEDDGDARSIVLEEVLVIVFNCGLLDAIRPLWCCHRLNDVAMRTLDVLDVRGGASQARQALLRSKPRERLRSRANCAPGGLGGDSGRLGGVHHSGRHVDTSMY